MEELTKVRVDWKKITVVGLLVLLTALISAGATWYVTDMFRQNELDVKDNEITTLQTKVEQLEAQLKEEEEETEEEAETLPTNNVDELVPNAETPGTTNTLPTPTTPDAPVTNPTN